MNDGPEYLNLKMSGSNSSATCNEKIIFEYLTILKICIMLVNVYK